MSDTRRWVQPGWGPDHPAWHYPDVKTVKHQSRDRRSRQARKNHKFIKGLKNSRHNLQRKLEQLQLKESTR
jgi:hypothetical protein